jgi:hypothetical protein
MVIRNEVAIDAAIRCTLCTWLPCFFFVTFPAYMVKKLSIPFLLVIKDLFDYILLSYIHYVVLVAFVVVKIVIVIVIIVIIIVIIIILIIIILISYPPFFLTPVPTGRTVTPASACMRAYVWCPCARVCVCVCCARVCVCVCV